MKWTKEPDGPGAYYVIFKGSLTLAVYQPHEDGARSVYTVDIIGSDASFTVAEFTAWCLIPNPPPPS